MKQIKLQEQFFGKDKEFRTTKILKKHPELLDGKPVEFEVVSPDYEEMDTESYVEDNCKNCEHFRKRPSVLNQEEYGCVKLNSLLARYQTQGSDGYYFFTNDEDIYKCPKNYLKQKGKKLGTMKLELELVGRFEHFTASPHYWDTKARMHISDAGYYIISSKEYNFIKDNEYFKENDLVVVLKVSEVERYGSTIKSTTL